MAAPVLTEEKTLTGNTPWLLKKYTFTAGNTATAFNHNGPGTPDAAWCQRAATNPTASESAVYSESATQFTLDCEATSGAVVVYCLWVKAAAQDNSSVTVS